MNIWLGVVTLLFILITTIVIYLKHKNIRSVIWNVVRFIVVVIALYFGRNASEILEIISFGIIIGACLLISMMHAYNKLFAPGATYASVGESRRPRAFGNDYWE